MICPDEWRFLVWKITFFNGPFSIAMFDYERIMGNRECCKHHPESWPSTVTALARGHVRERSRSSGMKRWMGCGIIPGRFMGGYSENSHRDPHDKHHNNRFHEVYVYSMISSVLAYQGKHTRNFVLSHTHKSHNPHFLTIYLPNSFP